jgi:sugar lactone lactonase YvrE
MRMFEPHALVPLAFAVVTVSTSLVACGGSADDPKARASAVKQPAEVETSPPAAVEQPAALPDEFVIEGVGFMTPESVLHDAVADVYLVSNIEGSPTEEDGNGFISRVTPDGEVRELKWIDGFADGVTLNAPKGMAIVGETLYVTDIDHVRTFDRRAGTQSRAIAVEGAKFLNDLIPAPDGGVYVSDSGADTIYKIAADDAVSVVIKDETLGHPNGLYVGATGLKVVGFGSGEMYGVDAEGARGPGSKAPKGGLDGIVGLADDTLFVSSWEGQAIYRVSAGGAFSEFMGGLEAPADIGLDRARARLLIPLFKANKVVLKQIK